MAAQVPAAARTMALFEVFAKQQRELSNNELAKQLNLADSSCSELVSTLVEAGYLTRSNRTRRIYPTTKLRLVAQEILQDFMIGARLDEACETLREKTGESAMCGRIEGNMMVIQAFAPGKDRLRYTSSKGDQIQIYVSAIGKAIVSTYPDEKVREIFGQEPWPRLASGTLTSTEELVKQVAGFRDLGWVYLENEGSEGLANMAIAGHVNGELMGLSIAGASPRLHSSRDVYLQSLREVANTLFDGAI
ncbi:IclR family transcriptional regulator [Diaphorobacter sp. HDW4A]|uniref:IclR family transcriptional regulator n=1 Tax=Diaphorobacter sp. HDW4A TaxID=2714924 RepID=UPI00210F5A10|nr:IclR family transcriptional regulator C-terminal domain-containing protein [Diaphorobacter sp. HDW4A]